MSEHVLGAALFVLALAAPLGLMTLQSNRTEATVAEATTEPATETPSANSVEMRSPRDLLRERLAGAVIEPGEGIGPLRLGAPYLLADARDAAPAAPGLESAATYLMRNEGWVLVVQTHGPERRITSLEMAANSCAGLADLPRADLMPSTRAAVTLGTHRSRLQRSSAAGTLVSMAADNDGIAMDFCPGSALLRSIRVQPWEERGQPTVVASAPETLAVLPVGPDMDAPQKRDEALAPSYSALPPDLSNPAMGIGTAVPSSVTAMADLSRQSPPPMATGGESAGRDVATLPAPAPEPVPSIMQLARVDTIPSRGVVRITQAIAPEVVDAYRPVATSDTEERLALSRAQRRELQRRLQFLGHPTGGADGILGPRSREAITALQAELGEVPTGFVNASLVAEIKTRSAKPYAAWQRQVKKAARRSNKVVQARLPAARIPTGCRRHFDGTIIENQSVSCDVDLLGESLKRLFTF